MDTLLDNKGAPHPDSKYLRMGSLRKERKKKYLMETAIIP